MVIQDVDMRVVEEMLEKQCDEDSDIEDSFDENDIDSYFPKTFFPFEVLT